VEAANSAVLNRQRCGYHHVGRLYERVKARRGHGKAIVAVALHLAEASFWMLKIRRVLSGAEVVHAGGERGSFMSRLRLES